MPKSLGLLRSWLVILALLTLPVGIPAPAAGRTARLPAHEYGTTLLDHAATVNGMDPVVFRHWVHRSQHTCRLCHVDIGFAMAAGQTRITREENRSGDYCGACHNGREAFACETTTGQGTTQRNCARCHQPDPLANDHKNREEFEKLAARLPEDRFGNGIDWARASREGLIAPRDFIAGVSVTQTRLQHEQGELSVDSKLAGFPDIVFSHREHATWNSCDLCHPALFALQAGRTSFTMQEIFAGRFCGACHGSVAFSLKACARCHTRPVM